MEDFIKFALAKNVRKYGFSSHAPLPFNTFWNMKLDDLDDYKNEFYRLKNKYSSQIDLYLGLEADYIHDFIDIKNQLYNLDDFDYLIASVHYMDRLPNGNFWTVDGNFTDFEGGLRTLFDGDIKLAVLRYFQITMAMIQKGGFDMVGHLDKIAMNGSKCKEFDKTASWYKQIVGETLEQIKKHNLILEINTKSVNTLGITFPDVQFYSLVHELKIPIVVNSDCHYPSSITEGFQLVYKNLQQTGFKTLSQLIKGNWTDFEFDENGIKF